MADKAASGREALVTASPGGKRARVGSIEYMERSLDSSEGRQDDSAFPPNKRLRTEEGSAASPHQTRHACTGPSSLLSLPIELLYTIHIYAKNPAFAVVSRRAHGIFCTCPTSIKVQYLVARWHEAYCYGFLPPAAAAAASARRLASGSASSIANGSGASPLSPSQPALPASPSSDLLDGGALPELTWSSRFIPVLPANEFPYPLSNSFQRSADHYILDYCMRYPLTTLEVLNAVERHVLTRPEFGNIVVATGLWRDDDRNLHAHEPRHGQRGKGRHARHQGSASCDEMGDDGDHDDDDDDDSVHNAKPSHLRVTELPRRLFQSMRAESTGQQQQKQKSGHDEDAGGAAAALGETHEHDVLDARLAQLVRIFGPGPLPPPRSLMLLLAVASAHVPTTVAMPAASVPFNSSEGLPLAKATFAQSSCLVQLLLALGAEPARKGSLSLYIAIRSGWLDGLQMLVERDEAKIIEWHGALDGIRAWFYALERRGARAGAGAGAGGSADADADADADAMDGGDGGGRGGEGQGASDGPAGPFAVSALAGTVLGGRASATLSQRRLPPPAPPPSVAAAAAAAAAVAGASDGQHDAEASAPSAAMSASPLALPASSALAPLHAFTPAPAPVPGHGLGLGLAKRRRLLDRVGLDHKMLKEAVKHNRWPVANWLRTKGVAPDLRTIKLIEMKQASERGSPGHGTAATSTGNGGRGALPSPTPSHSHAAPPSPHSSSHRTPKSRTSSSTSPYAR